jgi:hypothetical protein
MPNPQAGGPFLLGCPRMLIGTWKGTSKSSAVGDGGSRVTHPAHVPRSPVRPLTALMTKIKPRAVVPVCN